MFRSDTARNVATMADLQAVWNRAVGENPREPVCVDVRLDTTDARKLKLRVIGRHLAISDARDPQPASVRLLDLRPKTCFNTGSFFCRVVLKFLPGRFILSPNYPGNCPSIIRRKGNHWVLAWRKFGVYPHLHRFQTHDAIPMSTSSDTPVSRISFFASSRPGRSTPRSYRDHWACDTPNRRAASRWFRSFASRKVLSG